MESCLYTVGTLYPLPGHQVFVVGGPAAKRPAIGRRPLALFRKYRELFHVYRISEDCRQLSLEIASEHVEEETGEAIQHVTLSALQGKRLARAVDRALRRRQR